MFAFSKWEWGVEIQSLVTAYMYVLLNYFLSLIFATHLLTSGYSRRFTKTYYLENVAKHVSLSPKLSVTSQLESNFRIHNHIRS